MSNKHTCIIRAGSDIGQIATGRTVTLSWKAKTDVLITMQPATANRSNAQNRLAWMWAGIQAKHEGETKEDCHTLFKVKHLAPILARDDEDFAGYWERFGAFSLVAGGQKNDFWLRTASRVVSSGDARVEQMAEALTEWEMTQAREGLVFPQPEDYHFALQIESYEAAARSVA